MTYRCQQPNAFHEQRDEGALRSTDRVTVDLNVPMATRDGTILRVDIVRPRDSLGPVPAIVVRTPYGKHTARSQPYLVDSVSAASCGFAMVYQDVRGRWSSEGVFYPLVEEGLDGYDTVEWTSNQPWCDGRVGLAGASYAGAAQLMAAAEKPPHLSAIMPIFAPSEQYEGWTYEGGVFQLGRALYVTLRHLVPDSARRMVEAGDLKPVEALSLSIESNHLDEHYKQTPLTAVEFLRKYRVAPYYFDWLSHPSRDDYWRRTSTNERYHLMTIPGMHVGGWYDVFLKGTLENFVQLTRKSGTKAAQTSQRLLVGPWSHGDLSGTYAEANFGMLASASAAGLTELQLRFFREHLTDDKAGLEDEPPVSIFVMGTNSWRHEWEWPLKRTCYEPWFLHSDGNASSTGGTLSPEPPKRERPDSYVYDPNDPVPTIGGATFLPGAEVSANAGPRDQRSVESRPDVLVYTSEPLSVPLEVTGPLKVRLYAATSAHDTDFVARLTDVHPDGRSMILAEGVLRASFREGLDRALPVQLGRVYEYNIDLVATSNVFLSGHRVRLDITSSSFPRFARNVGARGRPDPAGADTVQRAYQRVFHDPTRCSHVLLPTLTR